MHEILPYVDLECVPRVFYVASTSRFCHEQHHILYKVFLLFYVRLQDGVPDTIAALREAGIKVGANFRLYS